MRGSSFSDSENTTRQKYTKTKREEKTTTGAPWSGSHTFQQARVSHCVLNKILRFITHLETSLFPMKYAEKEKSERFLFVSPDKGQLSNLPRNVDKRERDSLT